MLNSFTVEAIQVVSVVISKLLFGKTTLRQKCFKAKLKRMSRKNVFARRLEAQ